MYRQHTPTYQKTHITDLGPLVWIHQVPIGPLSCPCFWCQYKPRNYELIIIPWSYLTHLHLQVNIMDATHYWLFAWQYSIAIAILDSRPQTTHPQQYHRMRLHSIFLQWFLTAAAKPAIGNTLHLLCDHIEQYLQNRAHTRRWRPWEWQQEFKHSHSSQKSSKVISYLNNGQSILWSHNSTHLAEQQPVYSHQRSWALYATV